jgi:hypothetical protein
MTHAELHGSNSASAFLVILIRYFGPLPTSFIYYQLELYTKSIVYTKFYCLKKLGRLGTDCVPDIEDFLQPHAH